MPSDVIQAPVHHDSITPLMSLPDAQALQDLVAGKPVRRERRAARDALVVTVLEAAAMLRLDPRTVRDLFREGKIAGNQQGHAIRLSRASVLDWACGRCAPRSGQETT